MITIFIANTDINDLVATITDLNTVPPSVLATTTRINSGQQIGANVQEDGDGNSLVTIDTFVLTDLSRTKSFPNQSCLAGGTISVDIFGI